MTSDTIALLPAWETTKGVSRLTGATIRQIVYWRRFLPMVGRCRRDGTRLYFPRDIVAMAIAVVAREAGLSIQRGRAILPAIVEALPLSWEDLSRLSLVLEREGRSGPWRWVLGDLVEVSGGWTVIRIADLMTAMVGKEKSRSEWNPERLSAWRPGGR